MISKRPFSLCIKTPPVAVGLQEPGAYAAYNASMKAWRHAAIQPLCDMLAESDTEHLAPQFGEGLTVEIESATVDDSQLLEQQLQNDLAARVRTKNEWRAVRGMPPLPGTQGDELVGTDHSSETQRPQPQTLDSSLDANANHSGSDIPTSKSSRSNSVPPENQRIQERANLSNVSENSTGPHPEAPQPNPTSDTQRISGSNVDDDYDRAVLIAEILYGWFGEAALSDFDAGIAKAEFDSNLHPRDERGRFTVRGSPEAVAEARQLISRIVEGNLPHATRRIMKRLVPALDTLPTSELESIHRENGGSIPNRLRERLVEGVLVRLHRAPRKIDPNRTTTVLPEASPAHGVEVFLQGSDELERRLGRQLRPEEWGQLVGAQPGARVHVFPNAYSSVNIAVEHPDYSARRTIFKQNIENAEFEVSRDQRGKGLGVRIFSQQVETATRHGFKIISLHAGGNGEKLSHEDENEDRLNGYYTWARLGFDGPVAPLMKGRKESGNDELIATVRDFKSKFPGVKKVSEMMATKRGRDWWKKFGGNFEGEFDLRPNSKSRQVLARYLEEKDKENRKSIQAVVKAIDTAVTVDGKMPQMASVPDQGRWHDTISNVPRSPGSIGSCGEVPDQLSDEDEQILDRIWDEIGRESGIVD